MTRPLPRPRRRLGQHFLRDPNTVDRLVSLIDPGPDDHMVEVGPGHGALTERLVGRVARLHLLELDTALVERLRQRWGTHPGVCIHPGDALARELAGLAPTGRRLRLVGNLPYNISTPLLFWMLADIGRIQDAHFMLQREVVERIVATPGNRSWGRLGVMVGYHCHATQVLRVRPGAFWPVPRVESAVVRLTPRTGGPRTADPEALATVVRVAFSQRRKTLRNALRALGAPPPWQALGLDPRARPEQLAIADFVRLADWLAQQRSRTAGPA